MRNSQTDLATHMSMELRTAIDAAKNAGNVLLKHFENFSFIESTNKESWDLLTQADIEAEKLVLNEIRSSFPDHSILAEESSTESDDVKNARHLWIVDPLDGTNNFAHGIPHFAVSIAYYKNQKPELGVILSPFQNDLFVAVSGKGAWHNGAKVNVNSHNQLDQTMIGVGFYYDRGEMMQATLSSIEKLFEKKIHGIRRMGTAALDLVQVGLGRFGAYFEYTLSPWDFAAGRLFVTEAGGKVTDCEGNDLPLTKSAVLATNGKLHDDVLSIVHRSNEK